MKPRWRVWLRLFWVFFKTNWLTTTGPASIGLLYDEMVAKDMSERQFVEAVGFSNFLPGSAAVKLSVYIGYPIGGLPGIAAALLGAALPPILSVSLALYLLSRYPPGDWLNRFTHGLEPAVAVLIALVGWRFLQPQAGQKWRKKDLLLAVMTLAALIAGVPSPLVLLLAGLTGIVLYR